MRDYDECHNFPPPLSNWSTTRDVNTIVNSLCLGAPVIVFCAAEAPLGLASSREDRRDLPVFSRAVPTGVQNLSWKVTG